MLRTLLAFAAVIWFNGAMAVENATLIVREVKGDVRVESAGQEKPATVGATFVPPVQFRTAANATALIAQGDTTVRIAPGSVVAIPAGATPTMIDRVLQHVGSAQYNVKSRKGRSFSVETPYLTSVVKGTLFSVTVQGNESTVALLEGSLEVSGRGADTVMLSSGDTARLQNGRERITVERATAARGGVATAPTRAASTSVATPISADAAADLARSSASFQMRATTMTQTGPANPSGMPDPAPGAPTTPNLGTATSPTAPPVVTPPATSTPVVTPPVTSTPVVPSPAPVAPPGTNPAATTPVVTPPVVRVPVVSTPVVPVDDGNNGHGNDADGIDESNPGHRNKKKH